MRGVELSHHGGDCSFETFSAATRSTARLDLARIVHEAELPTKHDAPESAGLDVLIRGLSMTVDDPRLLALTGPLFDGLYEFFRRSQLPQESDR